MVAYNFNAQFASDVESGKKTQTIRKAGKKNPPNVGDQLQLYTGMRTKGCRFLALGECVEVVNVFIGMNKGKRVVGFQVDPFGLVQLKSDQVKQLATQDGFSSVDEFFDWFLKDEIDFIGYLIRWKFIHAGGVK